MRTILITLFSKNLSSKHTVVGCAQCVGGANADHSNTSYAGGVNDDHAKADCVGRVNDKHTNARCVLLEWMMTIQMRVVSWWRG